MYRIRMSLVWCFILIDDDSETLSGQPLGACRREWQALSKARDNADGRLVSCPEGGPLRPGVKAHCAGNGVPLSSIAAQDSGLSGPLSSSMSMKHHTSLKGAEVKSGGCQVTCGGAVYSTDRCFSKILKNK
jgi:hypothetical protein